MKNNILRILAFTLLSTNFVACEKDETNAVLADEANRTSGSLTANQTTIVLEKVNQEDVAITFNTTDADFGYNAALNNVLEFSLKSDAFAHPIEIPLPAKTNTLTMSVLELNQALLRLSLPFETSSDLDVRLKSSVGNSISPLYSNVVSLKVTPYALVSWVYVPGDYQGWDPATADSLKSATGNGIYEGIIDFSIKPGNSLEFKIATGKNWNNAYGAVDQENVSLTAGNNIKAPAEGSYKITLNTNNNTYEIVKSSWGVIGSATPGGWDNDTNLRYNNSTKVWEAVIILTTGDIKFRYNDEWGVNYGGGAGVLTSGGSDIPVTAGTYKLTLDIENLTYSLVAQ
jgi:hypothetical protein